MAAPKKSPIIMKIMTKLGRLIEQKRRRKRLPQKVLADALGISQPAVTKWEQGKVIPELSKLVKLIESRIFTSIEMGDMIAEAFDIDDDPDVRDHVDELIERYAPALDLDDIGRFQRSIREEAIRKTLAALQRLKVIEHSYSELGRRVAEEWIEEDRRSGIRQALLKHRREKGMRR